MTYYFSVLNLYLSCTNSKKEIVSDSINYHKAHFTLDSKWNGYVKTATFTNNRTNVSVMKPLDENNDCIIPFEVLEDYGTLDVCLKGNLDTTTFYTYMSNPIVILESGKTNSSTPLPPSQSVYDELIQMANDKYVNTLVGVKTIPKDSWNTLTELFPISTLLTPVIVNGTTLTLSVGNFNDYLDRISYPYEDFYIDYSTDSTNTSRLVATSEQGANPNLRRIYFKIGANTYELRVTSTSITIRRSSGTEQYYIHQILLSFDDFFYYDYAIEGFTTKHQMCIHLQNSSKAYLQGISFSQFPPIYDGYIRLNFSQKPTEDIETKYYGYRTDKVLPYAEWKNIYGDVVFKNVIDEFIDDSTTLYDNDMCTIGQIKQYINSKIV